MFLNILKRGPTPPQKLRIKTNYTHCTYNFNAQVTDDFVQNPLPADQQLGRQQLTRCGQPVKATTIECVVDNQYPFRNKIRKLLRRFQTKNNDNLLENIEIPTISWNL